jgi:DNA-directed RNA polymerase subunit RPC12/RpoP
VHWNWVRTGSTLGLLAATLTQVVVWVPMLNVGGCGLDDTLRFGQSLSMGGFWWIGCVLIWWGAFLLRPARAYVPHHLRPATLRHESQTPTPIGRRHMTPNSVRLALAMALVPLLPGLFWVTFMTEIYLTQNMNDWAVMRAYELCAVLAMLIWWALWRRSVPWTARRRNGTILLAALLLVSPLAWILPEGSALFPNSRLSDLWDALRATATLFAGAAWIAGTACLWLERGRTVVESGGPHLTADQVVRCPECSYSLTGLREVRCPECGWSATVDVLVDHGLERCQMGV